MHVKRAKVLGYAAAGFAAGSIALLLAGLIGGRAQYGLAGILAICALALGFAAYGVFRQEEPGAGETIVSIGADVGRGDGGDGGGG